MNARHAADEIGRVAHQLPERLLGGLRPLAAVWSHAPVEAVVSGMPQHAIALHLDGCTLVEKWSDGRLQGHLSRIGSVTLVPAMRRTRWVLGGHSRVAHLYVDPAAVDAAACEAGWRAAPLRDFFAEDDAVLAGIVRAALRDDLAAEALARDELLAQAHRHLARHYRGDGAVPAAPRTAALTAATLRRLFRHLDEHLAEPLPLAALAAIAGLSQDHFLRAFKAAVGQTPHQLVIARRIAEAQRPLHGTRLPVSEIATRCGFATPSHFSAAFRARLGVAPADWRRARRGPWCTG